MDDRTTTDFARTQPLDKPLTRKRKAAKTGRRLGLLILVVVAVTVGWWIYGRQPAPQPARQNASAAAVPVVAAPAVTGDIDITLNGLGTVTSLATVTIRSQISGQFVRIAYQEGQMINKGDLVAEIDSRPYELALAQAQGALERDQALLQTAELDLKRYQDLAKTNAIPRQQFDTQVSLVAQDKGLVIADQAQIDTQKLNIAYCHIIAPITGRAGLRLVDPGNYVTANDATGIVVLTQLQPISVIFTVAEDNLPQIVKRLRAGATLPVTAFDRSGATKLATGVLKTLDNQIDTTTGTLKLRAEFANEDSSLFPNQFVNVQLLIDTLHNTTVVPTSAIQRGAPGTFVYLVNADNTVTVKPVTLGPSSAERIEIQSGLTPGDRVVVDGADKLRNGAKVVPRNADGSAAGPADRNAAPATTTPATTTPGNATPGNATPGNATTAPAGSPNGGRRSRGAQ
ncbi:MAG TPA: MdtA/MuxA family multidrug efflux RND transporter periplasmic adaptor subunit [Xanthobacteraceae bacterium]|nr:MdtA/MuxA family multidrug efflux RND transporter periplasmic adaptor subunit [Xanthobacteraceae bacterium]